jgi:2-hydroxychromene-2-carboxylate isomerase
LGKDRAEDPLIGRLEKVSEAIAYRAEDVGGQPMLQAFCCSVMTAYFVENAAIDETDVLASLAAGCGLGEEHATSAPSDPALAARIEAASQAALDAGVWGAPMMIVDGEPFWGEDRIDQLDLWLERGGW